jgi:hypothetical protein
VFGAVLVTALPNLASGQLERAVSTSVETLISGDAVQAQAAAQQLKWLRVVPTKYRIRMANAYGQEFNPVKRDS